MSEPNASAENLSSTTTAGGDNASDEFRITEEGNERIFQDDDPEIVSH